MSDNRDERIERMKAAVDYAFRLKVTSCLDDAFLSFLSAMELNPSDDNYALITTWNANAETILQQRVDEWRRQQQQPAQQPAQSQPATESFQSSPHHYLN